MATMTEKVRELREKTGAGVMDCKEALTASADDLEKAIDYLRKKGLASAAKKAGRETKEGLVGSYVHGNGKIGVLVEVACGTDFVARTDEFQTLVRDLAMHVAAADPAAVSREEIDPGLVASERELMLAQVKEMGKPDAIADKIVEGKLEKWYGERALMEQAFVKDPESKIEDVVKAAVAKLGENIQIRRFSRFQLGA